MSGVGSRWGGNSHCQWEPLAPPSPHGSLVPDVGQTGLPQQRRHLSSCTRNVPTPSPSLLHTTASREIWDEHTRERDATPGCFRAELWTPTQVTPRSPVASPASALTSFGADTQEQQSLIELNPQSFYSNNWGAEPPPPTGQ